MDVFVYQSALLCADCALPLRDRLAAEAGASLQLMETGVGSDGYPSGPYANGGGEADTPQHCGSCGLFLENPLTPDGDAYVREAAAEFETQPDMAWSEIADAADDGGKPALAEWIRFYFAGGM